MLITTDMIAPTAKKKLTHQQISKLQFDEDEEDE
jgi:hypothetical protein